MERTIEKWAALKPDIVALGSHAQIVYCIADAQKDIASLAAENHRMKVALNDMLKFLTAPDWGQYDYMEGSKIYDDVSDAIASVNWALGNSP